MSPVLSKLAECVATKRTRAITVGLMILPGSQLLASGSPSSISATFQPALPADAGPALPEHSQGHSAIPHLLAKDSVNASVLAAWRSAIAADDLNRLKTLLNQAPEAGLLDISAPNGKNVLMVAAKRGDIGLVRLLVSAGVNVHTQTVTRGNALMFAALGGQLDVAKFLVDQGIALNAQGDNGWSALTIAVAKGHNELLRWLIDQGADFNVPDIYQWTPLMRAINNEQEESADILLDTAGVLLDEQDEAGNTALHHAVIMKNSRLVERLVASGADTQVANLGDYLPRQLLSDDAVGRVMRQWLE